MNPETALHVMYGAMAMASAIAGLFFLRFWREATDRLFLVLALAFWALTLNWLILEIGPVGEWRPWAYGVRLAAFTLILAGIFDKNRRGAT